jgi:hypothetical protein
MYVCPGRRLVSVIVVSVASMVFVKRVIVSRLSITVREVMAAPIFKLRYTSVQLASSTVKAKVLSGGVMGLSFLQFRFNSNAHMQKPRRMI